MCAYVSHGLVIRVEFNSPYGFRQAHPLIIGFWRNSGTTLPHFCAEFRNFEAIAVFGSYQDAIGMICFVCFYIFSLLIMFGHFSISLAQVICWDLICC